MLISSLSSVGCLGVARNMAQRVPQVCVPSIEVFALSTSDDVVLLKPPASSWYLAMSYVWGNPRQLVLDQNTYARLKTDGGLADNHQDISQSIKDTILLCEILQESYLRIDALCIKQDDIADRGRQIANMDLVYGNATLTIVAAAGNTGVGASASIPGMRQGTRSLVQTAETVKGINLVTAQRPFLASVAISEWNKRGWTLQEELLSKRLLVLKEY